MDALSLGSLADELDIIGVAWVDLEGRVQSTRGSLANWLSVGDVLSEGATVLNGLEDELAALVGDPSSRLTLQDITFGQDLQSKFHTIVVRWDPSSSCFLVMTTAIEASESSLASVTQLSRARRYYEDVLQNEREHFRSIYEHSPVFAFSCREGGQVVAVTRDLREQFLGVEPLSETNQISVSDNAFLQHFATTDVWQEVWSGKRVERRPWRAQTTRNQMLDMEVSGLITRHPTLDCLEGYFTLFDVTDLHAVQDRLRRSNKRFESTARQVAHDLLSPLRRISKLSSMIASEFKDSGSPALRSTLEELVKSASQGRNLVTDIVEVARTTAMRSSAEPVRPTDIMRTIEDEYSFDLEEIGARVEYSGDPVEVQGDETLMMQIYRNFLSNAIKYRDPERPLVIHHQVSVDPDSGLQITFSDNGRGFESDDANSIFEAYVRLVGHNDVHGTGIGLDIVKEAVDLLGWVVHADGESGVGAAFTLTIGHSKWQRLDEAGSAV